MKQMSSVLLFLLLAINTLPGHARDSSSITLDYPPQSIGQWYKPANKRQVWLHTMFRLRRSMQALDDYSALGDTKRVMTWAEKLRKDYLSLSDMVPEWKDRTRNELFDELFQQIERADMAATQTTLKRISRSCVDCHDKSQALVAAIYRTPVYGNIMLGQEANAQQSFSDLMEELPKHVNRILIALEDDNMTSALTARSALADSLDTLSGSCTNCHQKDPVPLERILGKESRQRLEALQTSIEKKQLKESQHLMAEIGVNVCARCHAVHRTIADLRADMLQLEKLKP